MDRSIFVLGIEKIKAVHPRCVFKTEVGGLSKASKILWDRIGHIRNETFNGAINFFLYRQNNAPSLADFVNYTERYQVEKERKIESCDACNSGLADYINIRTMEHKEFLCPNKMCTGRRFWANRDSNRYTAMNGYNYVLFQEYVDQSLKNLKEKDPVKYKRWVGFVSQTISKFNNKSKLEAVK